MFAQCSSLFDGLYYALTYLPSPGTPLSFAVPALLIEYH